FPGYIFCRFNMHARGPILKTPSVLGIAGIAGKPIPLDEHEIIAIQRIDLSKLSASPHPFLRVGQRVRLEGGALDGLEGIVEDTGPLSAPVRCTGTEGLRRISASRARGLYPSSGFPGSGSERQKRLASGFSRPARPADLLESAVRLLRYVGRGAGSTANRAEEEQYRGGVGHLRRCGIESKAGRRARPGFNDTPDRELAGERIHRK